MEMTARERLIATVAFEPVDRPVRWEATGFWNETLERWRGEGLPAEVNNLISAHVYNGFDMQAPLFLGAHEHPGLDPLFEEEVIESDGRRVIKRHFSGSVVKVFTDGASTPPHFLEFPVHDRASWERIRPRLDPATPGRLAAVRPFLELGKVQPWPVIAYLPGLFGTHRHLLGFTGLMTAYYDQPGLLHDVSRQWVRLWKGVLGRLAEELRPDVVFLWEDMCGKNGPLIGPATFEEFMSPYYKDLVAFAREELQVPVVGVDTDGDLTRIIGKFVAAGVNLLLPFEVQAGMDVLKVRRDWPDRFAIWGGIDKRALARDRRAIAAEVMRVVPPLLERGGYLPSLDHNVPPDVPLENWVFYRDLVRDLGARFGKKR